jgi:hypothetical protein
MLMDNLFIFWLITKRFYLYREKPLSIKVYVNISKHEYQFEFYFKTIYLDLRNQNGC